MSRRGSGRAPVGVGISGGVVAIGFAAFCAYQTLHLRPPAATLGGPVGVMDRRPAAPAGGNRSTPALRSAHPPAPPTAGKPLSPDVLFARASPAVVRINVHDGPMKPLGHGTGFFVTGDGLVVTNYHVIDGATYATVERSDGTVLRVEGVAAIDGSHDLALLKVSPADAAPLPVLALGAGQLPRVGTTVYAIGHPLGLKNVLSEGLVSSLGDPGRGQHFIQTTAAISPGSSGGPLMTADGVVVGVTTATVRDAQNLNFAMPADRVRLLLGQARENKLMALSPALRAKVAGSPRPAGDVPDRALDRAIDRAWEAMKRDRLAEAAAIVADLRGRGADSAYYWFTSGSVHMRLHNDDLAAEAFRNSLRLKPDKLATYLNLGTVCARQGKLQEAISAYDLAAKLAPADPRAYAQAGQAYARHDQPENAVPFFRKAARLDPANAAHHRDLGVALLHARQHGEALKSLQEAVSLKPDDARAYLFLGYAHHHAGNRAAAKQAWVNAERFDPPAGETAAQARRAISLIEKGREVTLPAGR